jgi:metal-dependent HD superfamily phosphatase/phosphodiesterase
MRTPRENSLDAKIIDAIEKLDLSGNALDGVKLVMMDEEVQAIQDYANTVSIVRLSFNDHGPVHMRTVALNAIVMLGLLRQAGIKTSTENEETGDFEDSVLGVFFASMLHDFGMTIGRQDHEYHSAYLAAPVMDRVLSKIFPDNIRKKVMIRALALEGIAGHMGNRAIHSLEAGIVQVADGCDMTKGRARIPMSLGHNPRGGNIHQYSANSIEEVRISGGQEKPIRIEVLMSSKVGLFQIEEVLLVKIAASTAKPYIELCALVEGEESMRYL